MYPRLLGLVAVLCAVVVPGCGPDRDVAVRPIFNTYDRVAIWPGVEGSYKYSEGGLQRQLEELMLPVYMNAFPRQRVVERRDLAPIMREQEVDPSRFDPETRAKLREIMGIKGMVFPNFTPGTPSQLAIKVIDTETGEDVAALYVEESGSRRKNKTDMQVAKRLIRIAVDVLKRKADEVQRSSGAAQ